MKYLLVHPIGNISSNIASHKAAQAAIYCDQLNMAGYDTVVNYSGCDYDYSKFDGLFVYHGNDWSGTINLFGGIKDYANIKSIIDISKFSGKIYSLNIDFPRYDIMLKSRLTDKEYNPQWDNIDWNNFEFICSNSEKLDTNFIKIYKKLSIGDSHSISLYRPGWNNITVPFKTLYGAIKAGFDSFIPPYITEIDVLEIYFGNIDIRHHIMRRADPESAVKELVNLYVTECKRMIDVYGCNVIIYELLPIENESRKLPKTGFYNGAPFYGTRKERDTMRLLFKSELFKYSNENLIIKEWVSSLINESGELGFEYMEKPKSVHLSRQYYPYWSGNKISVLDEFFN